ncbi:caspase drICE-like [Anticarsia gemmatalis]|uniref:caspase drICE-like n=1 Tax=Anticarsia gemmatalis TaxID=129554 RepID=UPI003F75EE55
MEETSPDIKAFNFKSTNTGNRVMIPAEEGEGVKFDRDALYYDMSGDKYLLIFNHETFQKTVYFKNKQPKTRVGTDKDVKKLSRVFDDLGFRVDVHDNLVYDKIIEKVQQLAKRGHRNTSCICIAILTHGDKGGEVQAADKPYLLSDIQGIFESQIDLVNKPKLFFVQACRGGNVDAGNTVQLDSEGFLTVPSHADFLTLFSTVEDHLSYRDAHGSWMIQALCSVLAKYNESLDLLQMITVVNKKVAYDRVTYCPSTPEMDNKKQMPETRYTLTKMLKFR